MLTIEEKRRDERVGMRSLTASIADGRDIFEGVIEDVSTGGFRIAQLPRNFNPDTRQYVTVISGRRKNFKFLIQPCWKRYTQGGHYQEVGFEIAFPPWSWTEFVRQNMPDHEPDDVWEDFK